MLVFINYWIKKCTVKHWNSLCRVLTSSTNSFHLLLSWTRVFQFGTCDLCTYIFSNIILPAYLWSSYWPSWNGFPGIYCLDHSCFLHPFYVTKPSQSLCSIEVYCVLVFYYFIQFLVFFIRQIPFLLVGPNIFLKIFLSNTISLLVILSFSAHVL